MAVSLDPHGVQEAHFELPFDALGADDGDALSSEELMNGQRFVWRDRRQHWRFVPQERPFAIWHLRKAAATGAET